MKQIFFYLCLLISPLILSSCMVGGGSSDSLIIAKSAIDTTEEKKRDRKESDERNRGECGEDRDCEDVCEEVYNDEGDRENEGNVERCLELPYSTAINFEQILEIIEEPYYADLINIEEKDFEDFLEISVAPWVEKTKRLSNEEAENLLKWIASESKVASAIRRAYDRYEDFDLYEGLQQLFEEIAPDLGSAYPGSTALVRANRSCAEFCSAMSYENLAQNQSFWEIADYSRNGVGQSLACSILTIKCRANTILSAIGNSHCPASVALYCGLVEEEEE